MTKLARRPSLALWFAISAAAAFAACGESADSDSGTDFPFNDAGTDSSTEPKPDSGTGNTGNSSSGGGLNIDAGGGTGGAGGTGSSQDFQVEPSAPQELTVPLGSNSPTLAFEATIKGSPAPAGWTVDRGEIGSVNLNPSPDGIFTPTGQVGGLVKVSAGLNGEIIEREILVKLEGAQNGANPGNPLQAEQIATAVEQLTEGGGIGGVGGEGLGAAISDASLLAALDAPAHNGSAEGLTLLYPYNNTVFPRGIAAPLLSWEWSLGDADAIQIELSTQSGSFSWKGQFAKPEILTTTGGKFIRHPIPQDIWNIATNSAGGSSDQLVLKLTVASGGQAYGPITRNFTIAQARLSGLIYYNSYGTNLAKNLAGAVGGDGMFGGAVLSIRVGDSGPQLVAGGDGDMTQCRVCHSVSGDGSRLVVQHGNNNSASSAYDLTHTGSAEHAMTIGAQYPGIYPDGSMAVAPNGALIPLPNAAAPLAATGLTDISTSVGTPAFSPDGKLLVINPMASPTITNPTRKLVVLDFDAATLSFSNPREVADHTDAADVNGFLRPGWAAFLPDGKSLVYHRQSEPGSDGNGHGAMHTRKGAKAQIYWTNLDGPSSVTPLNQLNGLDAAGNSYLPKLNTPISMACTGDGVQVGSIDADHGDDINVNYEPTVSPIPSGGYAWVVFVSRRMYGNVATIPPYCSDPRGVNLIDNVTPKKLWVAAINLDAAPGTDPSHPAFYLPGQELLAGNSRGFWVMDPCRPDGNSCETGDQCCNGYCQPNASTGELQCSNEPPDGHCSKLQERCETAADCCDPANQCLNGFCAERVPR